MKRILRRHVPRPVRERLRRICYFPLDTVDQLLGRRDRLTPPRGLMFVGRGDFKETGEDYLHTFVALGGLQPHHRVLDVGCGVGQMAVPLTGFLTAEGSYEGFDVVPAGIRWCRKNITARFPNFQFHTVDNYNKEYNPKGNRPTGGYRFPYENETFDFVFLTSVFTHMLPADVRNYLTEIRRVLKRGSRCLITFFLLGDTAGNGLPAGRTHFRHRRDGYWTIDSRTPERGIAYEESTVRATYESCGLRVVDPVRYGVWREQGNLQRSQDIIVATRT
ncbi:MAG: class I SAM-dependent methyltransferase [Candidatus Krumholzibacteriia bacterium]